MGPQKPAAQPATTKETPANGTQAPQAVEAEAQGQEQAPVARSPEVRAGHRQARYADPGMESGQGGRRHRYNACAGAADRGGAGGCDCCWTVCPPLIQVSRNLDGGNRQLAWAKSPAVENASTTPGIRGAGHYWTGTRRVRSTTARVFIRSTSGRRRMVSLPRQMWRRKQQPRQAPVRTAHDWRRLAPPIVHYRL